MSKQAEQGRKDANNGKLPDPKNNNSEYQAGYQQAKEQQKK